jgi:hypothetical protein
MLRFSVTPLAILAATTASEAFGPQTTVAVGGTIMLGSMLALSRVRLESPAADG